MRSSMRAAVPSLDPLRDRGLIWRSSASSLIPAEPNTRSRTFVTSCLPRARISRKLLPRSFLSFAIPVRISDLESRFPFLYELCSRLLLAYRYKYLLGAFPQILERHGQGI